MKPRLIKINGVWHCCLPGEWRGPGFIRFCGLGYTPGDAYRDWVACNYAP